MTTSAVERVIRIARRRLATQFFLDAITQAWLIALILAFIPLLSRPDEWWVPLVMLLVVTCVVAYRLTRRYPTPLTASLEIDSRFALHERLTAAVELSPSQRESAVGQAVIADAEKYAEKLRVSDKFPLQLRRSAWLVPLLAVMLAIMAFVWHPVTDTNLFTDPTKKPADLAKKGSDNAVSPTPFVQPKPNEATPDKPNAEKLAAIRAELDRLDREAKEQKQTPKWVSELTAAEDAARGLERESLDRLSLMEAQLKQLEPLAKSPEFKEGPAADTAKALSKGELDKAEKALGELAKAAAAMPDDPELRKQIEQLKEEIRKAAENTAPREQLEKLIEQAKQEGRDISGLQQELERLKAEQSQPLKDLAAKLDEAAKALEKGDGAEAAKDLENAAKVIGEIEKDAQAAEDAQGEAQRAAQMRADAGKPGDGEGADGKGPPGTSANSKGGEGGQASGQRPESKTSNTGIRDVRVKVPFIDPKGTKTPSGSGDFGNDFTKADPAKLAPAIQNAARSAPAAVAGQPLTPGDRAAVREFFERLGK